MKREVNLYEKILLEKVRQNDKNAFSIIFSNYYKDFLMLAFTFVKDRDIAEEIVQDVFVKFWNDRQNIIINSSIKSYLLKSVQNKCLDWLRHIKSREKYILDSKIFNIELENDTENYVLHSELEQVIDKILLKLPEEIVQTFKMNRFEGNTYSEIAENLNVSVRTVEVRISKAIQFLRNHLNEYF